MRIRPFVTRWWLPFADARPNETISRMPTTVRNLRAKVGIMTDKIHRDATNIVHQAVPRPVTTSTGVTMADLPRERMVIEEMDTHATIRSVPNIEDVHQALPTIADIHHAVGQTDHQRPTIALKVMICR